ncbi:hydroxyacid dehydrogenase [Microbacterium sp. HD4P20]|uniref:hydroxyacid dehydrogenase n=1 Tax=Microbacterium sp. HD4P20 TaxID=2864874 RepID=UPI0020A61765|nr:hydroxyacid dehydrogenase [Microbacterium sp. HD4P20]MCP2638194.1 hydroxyacid dehydrogenase [Microbacterium sp. HD4P20]
MQSASLVDELFSTRARRELDGIVDVDDVVLTPDRAIESSPDDIEILITGWGAPILDETALAHWTRLRAVVHSAGSVKRLVTPAVWERGIRVSSAAEVNAVPVAEYTLAAILLSARDVFRSARDYSLTQDLGAARPRGDVGAFGITVGLIGASRIGRRVLELLRPFDIECLLVDPSLTTEEARMLGAELTSLPSLLSRSQVVSVHAPALAETYRMIGRDELALMADGATLINTARGSLVDTEALVAEVAADRLRAVLDVTDPEPLPPEHALFSLSGATLTPHIAGSIGNELRRLGHHVVSEVERFVTGGQLVGEVTYPDLARIA